MIKLAELYLCTGCGACSAICPKACISMKSNTIGVVLPEIDQSICLECHACEKVCPILNKPIFNFPKKAYAAWSNNEKERRSSASGGIATAIYKYAIEQGYYVVGASQNKDFSVTHKVTNSANDIKQFKNSKYVFSTCYDIFPVIKTLLNNSEKVLFIGLPCQVAALRKLLKNHPNLLLIDVVCHGTTPLSYLQQHLRYVENQYGKIVSSMSFRDPFFETKNYVFALYDSNGNCFYSKKTKDYEPYNFGFHKGITYRENCYHCNFAKSERCSDLTLGDYHGLGKLQPVTYNDENTSLILCNTHAGKELLYALQQADLIYSDERPTEEPILGERQLRNPTQKNKYRKQFEKKIIKTNGDFNLSIQPLIKQEKIIKKYGKIGKIIAMILKYTT